MENYPGNSSDGAQMRCPACGSTETLPFAKDGTDFRNHPVWIGIAAGILLIGGYLLFMIISYLTFPLIVFAGILLSSKFINRKSRQNPDLPPGSRDYLCLSCGATFRR